MADKIEIINNWSLPRVFQELENGNMRIPRFQRAYVWERSKIVQLLNSIYKQYPIGSFFLWDTDKEMDGFCRDITELGFPSKPEANKFSFILDGQQRITSLYIALKGKTLNGVDYSRICFNLDKEVFKIPTLKTELNNIPAWCIFDQIESMKLVMHYTSQGNHALAQRILECSKLLTQYPVSIIKSMNMELDEVVTIFERINQGGKRLSLFDLVHASVWSEDFDLRTKIEEFNNVPAIKIFGALDSEIFTQSLALNIAEDCTNQHQLGLKNSDCKASWDKTTECLRLAIDFVKNLGVQQLSIIPYNSILAILQYYFFVSGKKYISADIKDLISGWFWTVTFSQRYSSSTLTRMNEDALWIKSLANGVTESRLFTVKLTIDDLMRVRMNMRSVIKNGILCLMALNSPVDFDNGDAVTLDKTNASRSNSKENHHFFPYSLYTKFAITRNDVNSVLNFAFITKRLNGQISANHPSEYLANYEKANAHILNDLSTHFISEDAFKAAKEDKFKEFITHRGNAIIQKINELCLVNDNTMASIDSPSDEEVFEDEIEELS